MSKKFLFLISFVLVVTLASSSYGDVVIGNFEDNMDGWEPNDVNITVSYSTVGKTLGNKSLKIVAGTPEEADDYAIWYTIMADGNDVNDVNTFKANLKVKASVTRRTSEWQGVFASYSNIGMAINAGGTGWSLWYPSAEVGSWGT